MVYTGIHRTPCKVRRYSCQILMILEFSRQIFENDSTKFCENPSSGSRVVTWGRTDRETDMEKVIVAFRNFANTCKDWQYMNNISCDCMLLVVIIHHKQLMIHFLTAWIIVPCHLYYLHFSAWTLDMFVVFRMYWVIELPSSVWVRRQKQFIMIYSGLFLSIIHVLLPDGGVMRLENRC